MLWFIVVAIIVYIAYKFISGLERDRQVISEQPLTQKFSLLINTLNEAVYNGKGEVTTNSQVPRAFVLYKQGSNQILEFFYSHSTLTVIWKYKYFQKEVKHEKRIRGADNLSIFQQERAAQVLVEEMGEIILNHQHQVMSNTGY